MGAVGQRMISTDSMNLMGLPAACVPASFDDGLPIGVQIVGRLLEEQRLLALAEVLEQHLGWQPDPPGLD